MRKGTIKSTYDLFVVLEEGEERKFLFRTGLEFSRFLTTLLNLKNGSTMIISTENKFSKLPGEVLKTAADSFYAIQFNFTMRRGTILKQLPDTDKDVLIKKWEDEIRLFLSPEAISVGDALELQEGSRVTVRGTFKEVNDRHEVP
ncbi:uncharacterized protein [Magallana gigas]|uniref:uncharacterized protein n=1 Tax=Magallana gigas TaxID=29159 RepID=UPI0033409E9E